MAGTLTLTLTLSLTLNVVWQACVDAYQGRETVWTIGYRGLNDYPFWNDEPRFNTTASRCKLISEAMAAQAKLVRGTPGRDRDRCATYLWSEMLELFLSGKLEIPPNTTKAPPHRQPNPAPTRIWPIGLCGRRRVGFVRSQGDPKD